ncbi:exopolysaccharide biosynthesis polyprenyl glycosylphosphotransferase [Streptomyces sp. NBC_01280]|uniref:exopolysaccharide biosynthesis polyprenyl glycosylphosphotransferase n=1 Tax=Streptomyces sp. NBC_01280 TaxID=2903810 RepID=UPI002E3525A3|nr:exopolysaccharide biosynthesis polyprenyl glycosylphosphotransferase [Streptomyces sp. NBC_01280]
MTAERTVASPAGQPRATAPSTLLASVIPPRAETGGRPSPAGRRTAARHPSRTFLLAADGTATVLSTLVIAPVQRHPLLVIALAAGVASANARAGLYRGDAPRLLLDDWPAIGGRIVVIWCVMAAVLAGFPQLDPLPAGTLAAGAALHCLLAGAGRGLVYWRRREAAARRPCPTLLIGPETLARPVAAALLRHPRSGVRPVGILADKGPEHPPEHPPDHDGPDLPVLGTADELRRAIIQNGVRRALLLEGAAHDRAAWLAVLGEYGCGVWEFDPSPTPDPARSGDAARHLAGFRYRPRPPARRRGSAGKRALDLVVSGTLLVLTSPVLLVCAVWLRLAEGPGVVFRQERVGKGGKPFTLLKFRTHRPSDAMESATRWSVADEERMGWFCRFLRRTSLDELLQLWNVFRGDMSLVGPRPERPYFVMQFSEAHPGYAERHRMPTGITGLAQIHGLRGDTSIEDRARFDNAYIDSWSLWQDISILVRTAAALVRSTGS